MDELRKRVLGKDWSGLDRFSGWTIRVVTPTVDAIGKVADGSYAATSYLDVGPYALDKAQTVSLDAPSQLQSVFNARDCDGPGRWHRARRWASIIWRGTCGVAEIG